VNKLLLFLFLSFVFSVFSQEIYITKNKSDADYIIYIVDDKSEADWIIKKDNLEESSKKRSLVFHGLEK